MYNNQNQKQTINNENIDPYFKDQKLKNLEQTKRQAVDNSKKNEPEQTTKITSKFKQKLKYIIYKINTKGVKFQKPLEIVVNFIIVTILIVCCLIIWFTYFGAGFGFSRDEINTNIEYLNNEKYFILDKMQNNYELMKLHADKKIQCTEIIVESNNHIIESKKSIDQLNRVVELIDKEIEKNILYSN